MNTTGFLRKILHYPLYPHLKNEPNVSYIDNFMMLSSKTNICKDIICQSTLNGSVSKDLIAYAV